MAIVIGALMMGRIERVAGCSVATRFSMINGVPLGAHASFIEERRTVRAWPCSVKLPP